MGLSAVLIASFADGVIAREAAAAPADETVLERSDEAAAIVTARVTGKRVRITSLTSGTSEFFALPEGRIEAAISAGEVRMRRGDDWVPIDLNLRESSDGSVVPVAHPAELKLSGSRSAGTEELASLVLVPNASAWAG